MVELNHSKNKTTERSIARLAQLYCCQHYTHNYRRHQYPANRHQVSDPRRHYCKMNPSSSSSSFSSHSTPPPTMAPTPVVYLEWRSISVELKSRRASKNWKKPTPIQTKTTIPTLQNRHRHNQRQLSMENVNIDVNVVREQEQVVIYPLRKVDKPSKDSGPSCLLPHLSSSPSPSPSPSLAHLPPCSTISPPNLSSDLSFSPIGVHDWPLVSSPDPIVSSIIARESLSMCLSSSSSPPTHNQSSLQSHTSSIPIDKSTPSYSGREGQVFIAPQSTDLHSIDLPHPPFLKTAIHPSNPSQLISHSGEVKVNNMDDIGVALPPPFSQLHSLPLNPSELSQPILAQSQTQPQTTPSSSTAKRLILNGVSGYALPGQLLAIMGASGAGKTTLLNVLSGRYSSSSSRLANGSVVVNGRDIPYASLSKYSKVVQQNDLLLPVMTVRELMRFAAIMKLPHVTDVAERERRITQVLAELGLLKCQHFLVGTSGAGDADAGGSSASSSVSSGSSSGSDDGSEDGSDGNNVVASGTGTGVSRSGISGGEQRRLSIGLELIADPQLLFLDGRYANYRVEQGQSSTPSGLDSSTAYTIVSLLKRLALNRGRTIILTIHSPSSKLFSLFDRLLLLAPGPLTESGSGARVAYHGPAGSTVMEYFEGLGLGVERLARKLGRKYEYMTVSDYLMALLERRNEKGIRAELKRRREEERDDEDNEDDAKVKVDGDCDNYEPDDILVQGLLDEDEARLSCIIHAYAEKPDVFVSSNMISSSSSSSSLVYFRPGSSSTLPWFDQLRHLTYRTYLTHIRSLSHLKAKIFTNIFLGLFVGLLYLQTDPNTPMGDNFNQTSIFNRVGFIFFVTCMQALITLVNAVLTFTEERGLFLRECSNRMYSISAYFLSKNLVELPLHTILSILFGTIGYAMAGLRNDGAHFVQFLFLLSLLGHAVSSIGLLLGSIIHIPILCVMLTPLTVIPFMLTSGFFINLTTIPSYIQWLTVISPHRYAFAGLMGLEFREMELHCTPSEVSTVVIAPYSNAPQSFDYCSMIAGRQVLDLLSLPSNEYWTDVGALLFICVGFRSLAFVCLYCGVRENRLKLKAIRRRLMKATIRSIQETIQRCQTAVQ